MKIAILHPSLDTQGGAERQILQLAMGLQKKDHEVTIYVSKLDKDKCYPDLINKVKVVETGGYGYKDMKKQIIASPYYMAKMAEKVEKCDVVNCHNYPATYAAVKVKKKFGCPIVWSCNEPPFPPIYNGKKFSKKLYSLIYRTLVSPLLIYNKIVAKDIDEIIVLDNMNDHRIKITYHKKPTINYTGLDFPVIEENNEKENNKYEILAVGRVDKGKRTEDAIQAIVKLKEKIPNVQLNVVGGGKILEEMKELAKKLQVDQEVIFHGKVSDQKLKELYSNCNVFLFTAENQSWGLVPLEAMSYGKPTLVSTGAGVSEVLIDKENCLKINPRDVNGIVKNVMLLYHDRALAEEISKKGEHFVKTTFSWDKYVDNMEKIFIKNHKNVP